MSQMVNLKCPIKVESEVFWVQVMEVLVGRLQSGILGA